MPLGLCEERPGLRPASGGSTTSSAPAPAAVPRLKTILKGQKTPLFLSEGVGNSRGSTKAREGGGAPWHCFTMCILVSHNTNCFNWQCIKVNFPQVEPTTLTDKLYLNPGAFLFIFFLLSCRILLRRGVSQQRAGAAC